MSQSGNGGLSIERPLYMLEGRFGYDNAPRRTLKGTHEKGHSRILSGSALYCMSNGWFFGGRSVME